MVRLEVGPEQLAEQVGEALQRGEVDRCLALGEVVDEDLAHRAARELVAVDELCAARLAKSREDPQRRRGVVTEHGGVAQQLVEERAPGAPFGLSAHLAGEFQELDAVPDSHLGDKATFRGEDACGTCQRLLCGLEPESAVVDRPGECSETIGVAGAGHLERQVAARPWGGEKERQARPDHVRADHHQQARCEVAERSGGARPGLAIGRVDQAPPVRRTLRATRQPSLLPRPAGPALQPAHDGQGTEAAALLAEAVLQGERR